MPRKKDRYEEWLHDPDQDPIALENARRERDYYVENLFLPIFGPEGPQWNIEWLVEGLIPKGYLCLLAGPPKSGKTCLATAIALSVACGIPFAGRPTEQTGVLWISAEESPVERNILLKRSPLAQPSTPLYTCYQPLRIDDEDSLEALRQWVQDKEAQFLIVDPLLGATSGRSLADSWAARKTLKALKQFCSLYRVTALVLHHQKRGEHGHNRHRVADNAQLAATASMNMIMSHIPASGLETLTKPRTPNTQHRTPSKPLNTEQPPKSLNTQYSTPLFPARLVLLSCEGRGPWANQKVHLLSSSELDYAPTRDPRKAPREPTVTLSEQSVIDCLEDGPLTAEEIIVQSRNHPGTIRNVITNLRRKGRIAVVQVQGKHNVYQLSAKCDEAGERVNEAPPKAKASRQPSRKSPSTHPA